MSFFLLYILLLFKLGKAGVCDDNQTIKLIQKLMKEGLYKNDTHETEGIWN